MHDTWAITSWIINEPLEGNRASDWTLFKCENSNSWFMVWTSVLLSRTMGKISARQGWLGFSTLLKSRELFIGTLSIGLLRTLRQTIDLMFLGNFGRTAKLRSNQSSDYCRWTVVKLPRHYWQLVLQVIEGASEILFDHRRNLLVFTRWTILSERRYWATLLIDKRRGGR